MRAKRLIRFDPPLAIDASRVFAMKGLAIVTLIFLAECAETRCQKWRDQTAANLQVAQLGWNDCSANPKCMAGTQMIGRDALSLRVTHSG